MATIASVQRLSPEACSAMILDLPSGAKPSFAIVDVRDNGKPIRHIYAYCATLLRPNQLADKTRSSLFFADYIGGHIKGSLHTPIDLLDVLLPSLVRRCKDKEVVVFHCSLSQQRGPTAARRYLLERDTILKAQGQEVPAASQRVAVLDGGFSGWQQLYGEDERLTEGFVADLWR